MYFLVNEDNTINFAGDHPVRSDLNLQNLTLVELQDQTLDEVIDGVPIEELKWDEQKKKVVRHDYFVVGSKEWRKQQAGRHIKQYYPLSKQLNILRGNDKAAKKTMVLFIDKCRAWSNDLNAEPAEIAAITP